MSIFMFPWPDMPGIWAIISEWFISGAPATVGSRSMFVRRLYRLACRRLRNALSNPSLDLLIHIGRQHSDQRHHPHHRGGPPRRKFVGFRLCDFLVHDHEHVLRIARHTFLVGLAERVLLQVRARACEIRRVSLLLRAVASPRRSLCLSPESPRLLYASDKGSRFDIGAITRSFTNFL